MVYIDRMRTFVGLIGTLAMTTLAGGWFCDVNTEVRETDSPNAESKSGADQDQGATKVTDATKVAGDLEAQADAALEAGDATTAEFLYRQAIAKSPTVAEGVPLSEAPYKLALLYLDQGLWQMAHDEIIRWREFGDKERLDPILCLTKIHFDQFQWAEEYLPKTLHVRWGMRDDRENMPDLRDRNSWEAICWLEIGSQRFAFETTSRPTRFLAKAAALLPDQPMIAYNYARALGNRKNYQDGIAWLSRAKARAKGGLLEQIDRDLYKFKSRQALGGG